MAGNVVKPADMTEALILAGADIVRSASGPARSADSAGDGRRHHSFRRQRMRHAAHASGEHCLRGLRCHRSGDISTGLRIRRRPPIRHLGGMLAGHDRMRGGNRYEERDGNKRPSS